MNNDIMEAMRLFHSGPIDPAIHDDDENSVLHWASFLSMGNVTKKLVECNATLDVWNVHGETPLLIACRTENWDIARYLLVAKASPNAVPSDAESGTPLSWAIKHGHVGVL